MKKKHYRQTFYYRGIEYEYRILSASLRRFRDETGTDPESINLRSTEGRYKLLYYCTCWKGELVGMATFVNDCKTGRVSFRPGAGEYSGVGITRLFASRIREFKKRGEL